MNIHKKRVFPATEAARHMPRDAVLCCAKAAETLPPHGDHPAMCACAEPLLGHC